MNINKIRFSGFADEAFSDIKNQIKIHEVLGWKSIDLRNIDGENICIINKDKFEKVRKELFNHSFNVTSFGSEIANWRRPITMPFENDVNDLKQAIPRMRELNTKYLRIMSYPNDGYSSKDWKAETFKRLKELTKIAEGEGIILLLENCDGWAVQSPNHFIELVDYINSRSFQVVFDPANPINHGGSIEEIWQYLYLIKDKILHFHVKDCKIINSKPVHAYPGEGDCNIPDIIKFLTINNYEGPFSIEPHIKNMYEIGMYLKYGNMLMSILERL